MARITTKSKLQLKRKQKGLLLPVRLCIVASSVTIILIIAFLLYQTDRAMFRQSNASKLTTDRSMQKNILLSQQQQQQLHRMNPNNNKVRLKRSTAEVEKGNAIGNEEKQEEGDGENDAKTNRRVEFDLMDLKDGKTGTITIETYREWSPLGVDRFWELITNEFYIQCKMFRVVPNFIAQFGIASLPSEHAKWQHQPILDDPVVQSNLKYTVTFAMSGKNTRTTQLFINMKDNTYLDQQGFTPIGKITSGMEYIVQINDQYKELPVQNKIVHEGNAYLDREFPGLTYISEIRVVNNDQEGGGDDGNAEEEEEEEEGDDDNNEGKGDDKKGDDQGDGEENEEEGEEEEEEEEEENGENGGDDENKGGEEETEEKGGDDKET